MTGRIEAFFRTGNLFFDLRNSLEKLQAIQAAHQSDLIKMREEYRELLYIVKSSADKVAALEKKVERLEEFLFTLMDREFHTSQKITAELNTRAQKQLP